MKAIYISILFVLFFGVTVVMAEPCSQENMKAADNAASNLKNWNIVFRFYQTYGQCNDGDISEESSDSIVKLLANHWSDIKELKRLSTSDPKFFPFVLRNINSTV